MSMSLTLDEFAQLILLSWGKHDGPVHLHLVDGTGQGANGLQVGLLTSFAPESTAYVQLDRFHSFPLLSHVGLDKARWIVAVVDLTENLDVAREVVNFIVVNGHQERVKLVVLTDLRNWAKKELWIARMTTYVPDSLFVRDARVRGKCIPTVLGGMKNLLQKKRERMIERGRQDNAQDDIELIEDYEVQAGAFVQPGL